MPLSNAMIEIRCANVAALLKTTKRPSAIVSWMMGRPQPAQSASRRKRVRVALACERCKGRKQKCDGKHPACSKCQRVGTRCEYVIPSKPMPFGRNHYVSSLEHRVAELEDFLAKRGMLDQVPSLAPYVFSRTPSTTACPDTSTEPAAIPQRDDDLVQAASPSSEGEAGDTMVRVLRDLSLESNGGYIGASSHFTIGRLVSSIIEGKPSHNGWESVSTTHASPPVSTDEISLSEVPYEVATKIFCGYIKHVATRYPVLQSTWIWGLHCNRGAIRDPYERSTLHLVYAIAGRFLETTGESNADFHADRHQAQVLQYLDEMLHYHDTRSVVTLLLLAVYSLRAEGGPGAWTYIGLAMRIAIDLGLHRQTADMNRLGFDVEMRKRLFWSCYTMDRQISIPLGRPFSVADHDIDVALPYDIDEACQDINALQRAAEMDSNTPRDRSTSLTAFLHVLQIRRIESSIQRTIYRVDQSVDTTETEVDAYLAKLERWKALIPLDAKRVIDRESVAFDGYDYYMVFYYKCLRLLLYPMVSRQRPSMKYVKACAQVCGGVAQTYKRLHQSLSVGYSLMALQAVFMAGLTLVYCAWLSPREVFSSMTANDINACCIVLFVITERWPAARKYRDAFEAVKQIVIDPLYHGENQQPRRAIEQLPAVELPLGDSRSTYADIVTNISGCPDRLSAFRSEPDAIGMEQVRYQMGSTPAQRSEVPAGPIVAGTQDCTYARNMVSEAAAQIQANQEPAIDDSEALNLWPHVGFDDLTFPAGIESFDLEGCSAEMGWMAETFGGTVR